MENATEALYMGAAVLIFVVALTISINAFGNVRSTSQAVLDMRDREYDYTYVDDNNGTTERIVSGESIVPSIYKAYKESYKIIFKYNNPRETYCLYRKKDDSGNEIPINYIDLTKENVGAEGPETFIKALLYGEEAFTANDWTNLQNKFKDNSIYLQEEGLYDKIKNKKVFKEQLGIYYRQEVEGNSSNPDADKDEKRVITYTELN